MDEPASALDPIATQKIRRINSSIKRIVYNNYCNSQYAAGSKGFRCNCFFYMGKLIEMNSTDTLFTRPELQQTEDYITGRFG
jgi:ABC-type phosphate transport system, ATPase component